LVLVIGAALGPVACSARIQRDAVAAIDGAGGNATYNWQTRNRKNVRQSQPPAPRWLVNLIGVDYFGHVTSVMLRSSRSGVRVAMSHVGRLTQLATLDAQGSSITDSDLRDLYDVTSLTHLNLRGTRVTDQGLIRLKGLHQLSHLNLRDTTVGDAGMAQLSQLDNLSELDLADTGVTDSGLANLSRLPRLAQLDLSGTRITDVGLVHLRGITGLTKLDLRYDRVTDAGVRALRQALPRLKVFPPR
jgi:hypothetical protein